MEANGLSARQVSCVFLNLLKHGMLLRGGKEILIFFYITLFKKPKMS